MSILDEIKKLDEQKHKLLNSAKKELLHKAEQAINELNALGFNYTLTEASTKPTGKRRTGIRDEVLAVIKKTGGASRADILDQLDAKGDTSAEQSISNALSALKKQNKVTADQGIYKAT